jgi:A/G-specific adenine glycosylase
MSAKKVGMQYTEFRARLLGWYGAQARDLPWRKDRDPYRVWVSEIMLQQTRVAAVIDHYHEFLRRFPTVEKLAAAREASVLAAWSGLGYYRRARMLHAAAKVIVREKKGEFPATSDGWRELPGIGRYTAAAIASIAFNEAVAVVDGNVERVIERIAGKRLVGEAFWTEAQALLDAARPGDFNQAMMELGATICTPRAPACLTCPVADLCVTRGELPATEKGPRQKKREIHFVLCCERDRVLLVQRPRDASLMAGMWELPETTGAHPGTKQIPRSARNDKSNVKFSLKHSITVTDYTVRVWRQAANGAQGEWVNVKRLKGLALTGLARKILRKADLFPEKPVRKLHASDSRV